MPPAFDPAKAEAFAGQILTTLNHGAVCLMLSVGHRTGLFDIMRDAPPATSDEIAQRAGLKERYVREWLGPWRRPEWSTSSRTPLASPWPRSTPPR
jgi:hypothetical protein